MESTRRVLLWSANLSNCARLWSALGMVCLLLTGCGRTWNNWLAKTDHCQNLVKQARNAEDRGDNRTAEQLLNEAVVRNPADADTRYEFSELLYRRGQLNEAADQLQKVLDQNPDDPRVYVRLAEIRLQQERYIEAQRLIDQALDMDPSSSQALLLQGKLAAQSLKSDAALAAYYRALNAEPGLIDAQLHIAEIQIQRGQNRKAAPLLRSILEQPTLSATQKSDALWALGTVYARESQWEFARQMMETAVPTRRLTAADWHQLALVRLKLDDVDGARTAVAVSQQLNPQYLPSIELKAYLSRNTETQMATHQIPDSGQSSSKSELEQLSGYNPARGRGN